MNILKAHTVFLLAFIVVFPLGLRAQATDSLGNRLPLTEMARQYPTDKNALGHNFIEFYQRLFEPIRDSVQRVLEIGILDGASHLLWRDYFTNGQIFGIDIKDYREASEGTGVKIYVADQSNRDDLKAFLEASGGKFDIIIDDGGHAMDHQQVSLGYLFQHLEPGGYYIIEDVHTSLTQYYPDEDFKVDIRETNTTLFMIEWFMRTGQLRSVYMSDEEMRYLEEHIETIELNFRQNARHSMMCVLHKKG